MKDENSFSNKYPSLQGSINLFLVLESVYKSMHTNIHKFLNAVDFQCVVKNNRHMTFICTCSYGPFKLTPLGN